MNLPPESHAKHGRFLALLGQVGCNTPNNGGTAEATLFRPLNEDGRAILFSELIQE